MNEPINEDKPTPVKKKSILKRWIIPGIVVIVVALLLTYGTDIFNIGGSSSERPSLPSIKWPVLRKPMPNITQNNTGTAPQTQTSINLELCKQLKNMRDQNLSYDGYVLSNCTLMSNYFCWCGDKLITTV
jgi:hypothetical protein